MPPTPGSPSASPPPSRRPALALIPTPAVTEPRRSQLPTAAFRINRDQQAIQTAAANTYENVLRLTHPTPPSTPACFLAFQG